MKKICERIRIFPLLALILILAQIPALGQTNTVGNISGTVRDQSGAVVAQATVVIQEIRMGRTRTVTTNSDGLYSALSLPVGLYTITTSPQGYKKIVASGPEGKGIELHISENLVVNLTLEVGQVTETVNVTAGAVAVETRSGNVSSLIGEKQVTELPLNGRNYAQLALMVPGVSPANGMPGGFAANGTGLNAGVDMSVNGNASNQNLWTVDGVNNMDVGSNRTLLVFPSIDAIQEFRVERNSFSAEFGQAQGAVINLVTKSGSNAFHGTLFEFLRNDALNANNFFLNKAGLQRPPLRYNNFGGNFSGPIIKDRVFFFWSEEWRREQRGIALPTQKVPTAAEKVGNFSGEVTTFATVGGVQTPVRPIDPLNGLPFPGNIIPTGRLSPAGLAMMKVYPDPNFAASTPGGNNWVAAPMQPINNRQDLIRGDIVLNNKMNLMVRYINEAWTHARASGNFWGDAPFPTLSSDWDQPSRSFAVKLSTTVSSSSVNEFQFSRAGNDIFIRTNAETEALNNEIAAAFPSVFPREEGVGLPTVWAAGGYAALWHQAPWTNHEDLWIWRDDFSKVIGSHDFKVGGLFSHNIKNEINVGANEAIQFGGTDNRTRHAIADLLVRDLPLSGYSERDHRENVLGRWRDLEFYFNDSWKVQPRLTLNLGLRWSRYASPFSNNDRVSNYLPENFSGTPLSGLLEGQTGVKDYNWGLQPRIGVAWDISGDGKMALRLGLGRFLSRTNVIEDLLRLSGNPSWTTQVSTDSITASSRLTDSPNFRSLDTINSGVIGNTAGVGPNTTFNALNVDFRPPESWQWNLTISREVMKNTVVEASYIGNHGYHIWRRGVNFNDIVPSARTALALAAQNDAPTQAIIDANRRLVGLGPLNMSESTGNSSYHGFQVWANRRFSDRLAFQASYSWGHAITDVALAAFNATTTDPFNYSLDRGDADLDRRQMFVFNTVYSLPSFKNLGRMANGLLGDWQFNVIGSFLGGAPLDVIYSNGGNNTAGVVSSPGGSGFRPDLVTGVPIYLDDTGGKEAIINPAAFALPGVGRFGSLGRGLIKQPGTETIDFAIAKNWRVRERFGIQFRTEMFNIFNHTNFNLFSNNLNLETRAANPNFGKSTNGEFGRATGTLRPREIQFGLKFTF